MAEDERNLAIPVGFDDRHLAHIRQHIGDDTSAGIDRVVQRVHHQETPVLPRAISCTAVDKQPIRRRRPGQQVREQVVVRRGLADPAALQIHHGQRPAKGRCTHLQRLGVGILDVRAIGEQRDETSIV